MVLEDTKTEDEKSESRADWSALRALLDVQDLKPYAAKDHGNSDN